MSKKIIPLLTDYYKTAYIQSCGGKEYLSYKGLIYDHEVNLLEIRSLKRTKSICYWMLFAYLFCGIVGFTIFSKYSRMDFTSVSCFWICISLDCFTYP